MRPPRLQETRCSPAGRADGGGARFVSLPWQELYRPFVCRLASLQGGGLCAVDELHASSFYTPFILEVPDNWEHQCYFNLPLDELEQVVRRALSAGKTVAWHGDVSEDTFSPRQGMALWTQHPVTQEMRQHEFERFLTTDDHMMHLIGTAHDEAGRFYYLLKNSYGRYGAYAGLLYMSEDYFRAKTVSVLLRK